MSPNQDTQESPSEVGRRHATLVRLLRTIRVGAASRESSLPDIVADLCRYMDWPLGHAHAFDPSSGTLVPTMIWYEERPGEYQPFIDATARLTIGPDEGLLGRAFATRAPSWVTDVAREGSPRAEAARASGLRAGVAVPVFSNGSIDGVLEIFSPSSEPPDTELLTVLDHVGFAWSRALGLEHLEVELGHSEERYRALVDAAADAVVSADESGRITSWNPAAQRMFGYRPGEVLGKPLTVMMPRSYRDRHRSAFDEMTRRGDGTPTRDVLEVEGLAKDGRIFPVDLTLATWINEGKRFFVGILRDISERRAAEEELHLIESATAQLRDAIVVSTAGSAGRGPTILYVNDAFTRMTGHSESEVLGRSFGLLAGPKTDRDVLRAVNQRLGRGEPVTAEVTAHRKDGTEFLLDWHASPIYDPDGEIRHFTSILRDITEERRMQQAMRRVDRDALTELVNRTVLEKRLAQCMERLETDGDFRFALLFLDLDGFKSINDVHGHVVGDELLTAAARRLERTVRPGDTLARFGGDEFVILVSHVTDISDVIMVAERVQERLSAPFEIDGAELTIAASIGIALSEAGYDTSQAVIEAADAAMYEAKRKGKGRVEFANRGLHVDIVSALGLRGDLNRCIEDDQLELRYQPLVDLGSQEIIGFEALVRWRHPELGLLLPDRFIPLAEETGMIIPIGLWVLRTACGEARQWPDAGPGANPPTLSVNLSMRELGSPHLVDAVQSILVETGMEASRLQLELTESVLAESLEPVRERIAALRAFGITVCIDDFGTGYSSLGYLRHFPVDKIKIDRLFIRHLEESPENHEILRTILALAQRLRLEVVAEGVETEHQLVSLREMACGFGQGFLFSAPVPADQAQKLLMGQTRELSRHS